MNLPASSLSVLLGALFFAAPASSADLVQVYRDALGNDQQYAAARAVVEAGREKAPQGLAGLLPTIRLAPTISHHYQRVTVPTPTMSI
jgi:outer membrane protein